MSDYRASLTVPSRVESIRVAARFIVEAARSLHVPPATEPLFEVAIVEALSNAFKHGNQTRPDASILCQVEVIDRRLVVRIFDKGSGFHLPPPVTTAEGAVADIDSIAGNGHGLRIIQAVFPMVRTLTNDDGFGLEMALTFTSP
jgi:anti-sigma regulatory factor (Ser/Thr protein kinase)